MSAGLIFKQIIAVMGEIEAIAKNRNNASQGFKFRGIDDIYNELHPRLAKHGIFTVPEVLEERREERPTKSGGVMVHVILKIKFTFFAEDGSSVAAIMVGEGSDTGDKASNKAQAVAHKYALLQVFAIPTEDSKDPDAESPEFAPVEKKEKKSGPSIEPSEYICSFGKYKGLKIAAIDLYELNNYVAYIEAQAKQSGKKITGQVADFMNAANEYLNSRDYSMNNGGGEFEKFNS